MKFMIDQTQLSFSVSRKDSFIHVPDDTDMTYVTQYVQSNISYDMYVQVPRYGV